MKIINLQFSSLPALFVLSLSILLSGCVSIPTPLSVELSSAITIQQVQQNTVDFQGQTVRWGGIITKVINQEKETWVEVLALELTANAKPKLNRRNSSGRFIAKVSQFLDPEIYEDGYSITFVGKIADKIVGKIGEFKYTYPVIEVENHYLWPKVSYRRYPYITPGFWYYGISPYWGYGFGSGFGHGFGYGYYGYGVRLNSHYFYPYYPIYGHLERTRTDINTPRTTSRSGVFIPRGEQQWSLHTNPYWNSPRVVRNIELQRVRGFYPDVNNPNSNYPLTRPNHPGKEVGHTSARPTRKTHLPPRKLPRPIYHKTTKTK